MKKPFLPALLLGMMLVAFFLPVLAGEQQNSEGLNESAANGIQAGLVNLGPGSQTELQKSTQTPEDPLDVQSQTSDSDAQSSDTGSQFPQGVLPQITAEPTATPQPELPQQAQSEMVPDQFFVDEITPSMNEPLSTNTQASADALDSVWMYVGIAVLWLVLLFVAVYIIQARR